MHLTQRDVGVDDVLDGVKRVDVIELLVVEAKVDRVHRGKISSHGVRDRLRIDVDAVRRRKLLLHALCQPSSAASYLEQSIVRLRTQVAEDATRVSSRLDWPIEHRVVLRVVRHSREAWCLVGKAEAGR
jgi:hypothetical protein